jgi:hypothetical protein
MSFDQGRTAFVLVAIVFLGWFALGTQWNIRRGHRLLRWLQGGLPLLGQKTTLRWLGSSAIELKVTDARAPLRSAEVVFVLEPRDLPLLWVWFRARGRRDLLIIRGELRAAPRCELEAVNRHAWSTRAIARGLARRTGASMVVAPGSPLIAQVQGRTDLAAEILARAELPGVVLIRLAVHPGAPNLEVQWSVAGLEQLDARRVMEAVHQVAAEA